MTSAAVQAVQKAVEKALTDEEDDSFEKIDYVNQQAPDEEEQKDAKIAKLEAELADARRAIDYYSKECLAPPGLICVVLSVVFMVTVGWHMIMYGACASCSHPPNYSMDSCPAAAAPAATFECPKIPKCPPVPKCEQNKCVVRLCEGEKRILLKGGYFFNMTGNVVKYADARTKQQSLAVGDAIVFIDGGATDDWARPNISRAFSDLEDDLEVIVSESQFWHALFIFVMQLFAFHSMFTLFAGLMKKSSDRAPAETGSVGPVDDVAGEQFDDDSDVEDEEEEEDEQESECEDDNEEADEQEEITCEDQQTEDNEVELEDDETEVTASEEIAQQTVAIEDNKVELEMFQSRVASAHVDWMVLNAQVEMLKKTRDELIKKNAELEEMQKAPVEHRTCLEQTLDESLVPENGE